MIDWLQLIAYLEWIALGIICFHVLRKWNKKFAAMHDEMQEKIEEMDDYD